MERPIPFIWLESGAAEAAAYYISLFPDSEITESNPMVTTFRLNGTTFTALNGGPHYKLNPAFSIQIPTDTQEETDRLWHALVEGGEPLQCGWLVDRWGVSWQIVPKRLIQLLLDPATAKRATDAMMPMQNIDMATIEAACA
ncbi:MAG: VOC family protein [Planctomycetota bacterium]